MISSPLSHTTKTDYLGTCVYQDDALQFSGQKEGRIRKKDDGTFVYDYFLKDHLGNVRMVLTEEQKTDVFPTLDWEGTGSTDPVVTNQDDVWSNSFGQAVDVANNRLESDRVPPPGFGAAAQRYTSKPLQKSTNGFGAGMLLKVMAGDQVNTSLDYYYTDISADNSKADGLTTMVTALANAIAGSQQVPAVAKAGAGAATAALEAPGSLAITAFQGEQPSMVPNQPTERLTCMCCSLMISLYLMMPPAP